MDFVKEFAECLHFCGVRGLLIIIIYPLRWFVNSNYCPNCWFDTLDNFGYNLCGAMEKF